MPVSLPLHKFLEGSDPILDVRSPSEYQQGHIPLSHSFPLFSDHERSQIGTIYKQHSHHEAVELGLELIPPKLNLLLDHASLFLSSIGKVLCWRGGMRSGFIARLLELMGYTILTLQGGYKAYRRWTLQHLAQFPFSSFCIIGGLTGSGKTAILHALYQRGEQVIDLEALAKHRGSAFGGIGFAQQPTQEQFENELAFVLKQLDRSKPIWIEDESRMIGRCRIPTALYDKISQAPLIYVDCPLSDRLQHLLKDYGQAPKQQLLQATDCLAKRLGSELTNNIKQCIENEKNELAFEQLLSYYDKTYQYQLTKRQIIYTIQTHHLSSDEEQACALQNFYKQKCL